MKTFNGSQELKMMYVNRIKNSIEMGNLRQMEWGSQTPQGWQGCLLGTLSHQGKRENALSFLVPQIGLPYSLLRYIPFVFDNIETSKINDFALRFVESIPVGIEVTEEFVEQFVVAKAEIFQQTGSFSKFAYTIGQYLIDKFQLMTPLIPEEEAVIEEVLVLA